MINNPVIPGFHPDPSVCRVGANYYLACSSFEYFPAVPVFHSTDLSHWRQVGNALDRPEQVRLGDVPSSGGVFAPTLRHHDGRFWLATTNLWDGGHLIVSANDPAGPWSDPVHLAGIPGIDPDLAWDSDGYCWLTYAMFADDSDPTGCGGIMQVRIDPRTGVVFGVPRRLWSGTGLASPEAPHLYHVDGWWYLVIAEGGTERGHAVSVARARSPQGPFTGWPGNPALSHRSRSTAVQNVGHADLLQAVDGSWWAVVLGVRPRGGTPAYHVLGRETFLTPVVWVDGWPVPQPVTSGGNGLRDGGASGSQDGGLRDGATARIEYDGFDAETLAHPWVSIRRRPPTDVSLTERPGWLVLHGTGDGLDDPLPTFVGRRQQHLTCSVRALVDAGGGTGGLAVRLDERHHYEIEMGDGQVRCRARIGPLATELARSPIGSDPVVVRIDVAPEDASFGTIGAPPDRIRLGLETADGAFTVLGELDGRYLSTEVAGGFTGRVIGAYAVAGTVAIDWCAYTGQS